MASGVRPPRSATAPFDSEFENEESRVRSRRDAATDSIPRGRVEEPMAESVTEWTTRIEKKLGVAELLLHRLSPTEPRARLLASAMLRRDETLLDAILADMSAQVVALASTRWRPPR